MIDPQAEQPNPNPAPNELIVERYAESNRKTKAFYVTLGTIVFLFGLGHYWVTETNSVISSVVQLASIYIGGLAINDTMRYYKFGSNTLGDPEKQRSLTERYGDK